MAVTGLIFSFPVFFLALVRMGMIKTRQFSATRKYVYVELLTAIALLTPDPTLVSDILIFIPIVVSRVIGTRIEKKTVI